MNVIMVAIGSAGDVHPFIGLGQTLLRRGHRVAVCANPAFRPAIEGAGLRFLPVGTAEAYERTMRDPALWAPRTSLRTLWAAIANDLRPLFDLLSAAIDDQTVLIGSLWAFSARMVQEKFGVPYLNVHVSPSTLLSAHAPPVHPRFGLPQRLPVALKSALIWSIERGVLDRLLGPALNRVRRDLGLPPVRRVMGRWLNSPQGTIGLFPPWFAPPQPDWPAQVQLTGFPLFDTATASGLDDALQSFLDQGAAPVVVTSGSTALQGSDFFRAALAALGAHRQRGIVLGASVPGGLPVPADVLVRPYVPLSRLLPRCAAIVHHGGIGTGALALAAGIPQIITPFAHDQFDNAARFERIGAGISLHGRVLGPGLDEALDRVANDPALRERSRHWQLHTADAEVSRARVALALERLHGHRTPPASTSCPSHPLDHVSA